MNVLPVSNIINVTITNTPSGLTERNVNSLAILTHEPAGNIDPFREYISASQVAEDYGTESMTAKMANAIFAQTPNIRTGTGRLVIIPMVGAVSATEGTFVSSDLTPNIADLILVNDGDLRVNVDGTNIDITGLDFTQADDLADIAKVIQAKITNATVTATETTITITSKKVGDSSEIAVSALAGGSGTDLAAANYINASGGTATSGTDSSGETVLGAVARTAGQVGYVPVITTLKLEDDAIVATANGIQAQDRMFLHQVASTADILGVATTIRAAGNTRTRILIYTGSQDDAALFKAAYAGRGFSVNFSGSNTSQTLNLKQLATITPDPNINQTLYQQCEIAGCDAYVSYDGVPSIFSTGGNDFFDNPYSDLALKFALETAGFNFLRQTNTKVPQTEDGMNGLKATYAGVLERFVRSAVIAAGSWTSSERFGDPEVFTRNIAERGYYIFSLPITQQNPTEREARKAPLVQIAGKRAGAIHTGDVIVLIND